MNNNELDYDDIGSDIEETLETEADKWDKPTFQAQVRVWYELCKNIEQHKFQGKNTIKLHTDLKKEILKYMIKNEVKGIQVFDMILQPVTKDRNNPITKKVIQETLKEEFEEEEVNRLMQKMQDNAGIKEVVELRKSVPKEVQEAKKIKIKQDKKRKRDKIKEVKKRVKTAKDKGVAPNAEDLQFLLDNTN